MITQPKSKEDERPVLPSNGEFRKSKGRSPDRFDACKFACAWLEDGDKLGDPKRTDGIKTASEDIAEEKPRAIVPANDVRKAQPEAQSQTLTPFDRQRAIFQRQWGQR